MGLNIFLPDDDNIKKTSQQDIGYFVYLNE
jgi:hypothetical protein